MKNAGNVIQIVSVKEIPACATGLILWTNTVGLSRGQLLKIFALRLPRQNLFNERTTMSDNLHRFDQRLITPPTPTITCGDYYEKHSCEGCGDFLTVCMADFLCDQCHADAFDEGKDEHLLEDL